MSFVWVLCLHVSVYTTCIPDALQSHEGVGFPGTGITEGCVRHEKAGIDLRSSGRTANALNHLAIPSASSSLEQWYQQE